MAPELGLSKQRLPMLQLHTLESNESLPLQAEVMKNSKCTPTLTYSNIRIIFQKIILKHMLATACQLVTVSSSCWNLQPRQAADERQDLIIKVIQAITCSPGHWSSKGKVTKNGQAELQTHTSREFHVFIFIFCWFRNCSTHAKSHSSTQDFDGLLLLPAFHEGDALLLLASGKCLCLDGQSWTRTLHYHLSNDTYSVCLYTVYILLPG